MRYIYIYCFTSHAIVLFLECFCSEKDGWTCTKQKLTESLDAAKALGKNVRGLVVINPGNPTGQVLDEASMREIVEFCCENDICLMADEVYQENIWKNQAHFHSFRKVAYDMGVIKKDDGKSGLQLISFHSTSKGFLGECGLRGGYFELLGFPADVKAQIYKVASISLCSNVVGQLATGLMVRPPKTGDASFDEYVEERDAILSSLKRRAQMLSDELNTMEGMKKTFFPKKKL